MRAGQRSQTARLGGGRHLFDVGMERGAEGLLCEPVASHCGDARSGARGSEERGRAGVEDQRARATEEAMRLEGERTRAVNAGRGDRASRGASADVQLEELCQRSRAANPSNTPTKRPKLRNTASRPWPPSQFADVLDSSLITPAPARHARDLRFALSPAAAPRRSRNARAQSASPSVGIGAVVRGRWPLTVSAPFSCV